MSRYRRLFKQKQDDVKFEILRALFFLLSREQIREGPAPADNVATGWAADLRAGLKDIISRWPQCASTHRLKLELGGGGGGEVNC